MKLGILKMVPGFVVYHEEHKGLEKRTVLNMYLFIVFILSLFLTIALIPIMKSIAFRVNLVDMPDSRKVHVLPMPRSGGISMAIGAVVPVMLWVPRDNLVRGIYIGCFFIVVCGIIDDIKNMRYYEKLFAQIAGAFVVIFYSGIKIRFLGDLAPAGFELPFWVSIALTLLFIVGVTNAINLSDGLDGLAGGISVLSFVAIVFFAYKCGNMPIAIMSVAMTGAILGFLRYNTYPAQVFMGDAGSQMLGFLCAVFTIVLTQSNTPYSEVTPLFLIGFPVLDTLTVMVERISKRISPFKADKNHFHHKLLKLGLYHSESVLIIYILQTVFICFAFILRFYSNWLNLIVFIALAGIIIIFFEIAEKKQFKFRNGYGIRAGSKSILAYFAGERLSIRVFFGIFKWGLAIVLFLQCFIPENMPVYMSIGAVFFSGLILWAKISKPEIKKTMLRIIIYCTIPMLICFSTIDAAPWMTDRMILLNTLIFISLIVFVIATLNLTRRQKGFKVNPLDFLIFIVIIVFPNLPSVRLENHLIKLMVAKILILFFSYDVFLGEIREEDTFLENSLLAAFFVIALKGFI